MMFRRVGGTRASYLMGSMFAVVLLSLSFNQGSIGTL